MKPLNYKDRIAFCLWNDPLV